MVIQHNNVQPNRLSRRQRLKSQRARIDHKDQAATRVIQLRQARRVGAIPLINPIGNVNARLMPQTAEKQGQQRA